MTIPRLLKIYLPGINRVPHSARKRRVGVCNWSEATSNLNLNEGTSNFEGSFSTRVHYRMPAMSQRSPVWLSICLLALLFFSAPTAHAQGCSMCRDTTAGSAPEIRAGLRKAIPVLAIPAIGLFVGFFVIARRSDAWHQEEEADTERGSHEEP